MIFKHGGRALRLYYLSLRDTLHIEGYYDGMLSFDELEDYLKDLNLYIQKVEALDTQGGA